MKLTDEEAQELERLETAFEENGGRGVEIAERLDSLRRRERLVERRFTVEFTVLEDTGDPGRLRGEGWFKRYVDEMLEIDGEDPDRAPHDGFWVVGSSIVKET